LPETLIGGYWTVVICERARLGAGAGILVQLSQALLRSLPRLRLRSHTASAFDAAIAFVYFEDVTDHRKPNSTYCISHIRPFEELAKDLANNSMAQYNFVTPNVCHDMHDACSPVRNKLRREIVGYQEMFRKF